MSPAPRGEHDRKSGKDYDFVHIGGIDLGPLKSGMRIQVTGMLRDWGGRPMVVGAWAYSDMPWPLDDGAEVDYSS